jgi:hypothetical protein
VEIVTLAITAVTVHITRTGYRICLREHNYTEGRIIMGKLAKILLIIVIALAMIKGLGELFYFSNVEVTEEETYQEEPREEDKL